MYSWVASSSSGASLPQDDADCECLYFGLLSARMPEIFAKIAPQWSFERALTVGMYWVAWRTIEHWLFYPSLISVQGSHRSCQLRSNWQCPLVQCTLPLSKPSRHAGPDMNENLEISRNKWFQWWQSGSTFKNTWPSQPETSRSERPTFWLEDLIALLHTLKTCIQRQRPWKTFITKT